MMIDLKDNSANEESLAPAATILTTIALAPLMGATLSFLSPVWVNFITLLTLLSDC